MYSLFIYILWRMGIYSYLLHLSVGRDGMDGIGKRSLAVTLITYPDTPITTPPLFTFPIAVVVVLLLVKCACALHKEVVLAHQPNLSLGYKR